MNSSTKWLLVLLTSIGCFLRFYNLGANSLWLDEASTYTFAQMSISGIWLSMVGGEFNPPLFYWIEHFMLMFGNSEFVLRFIPAVFGTATIPMIYYVGKEFIDENVGIISAAFFTISPFLILYSQEARSYSMMLFFITATLFFYFKSQRTKNSKDIILFSTLSAIAVWSNFYAVVIIAPLIIYKVLSSDRNDIVYAPFAALCLPLLFPMIDLFVSRTSLTSSFGIVGINIITESMIQLSGFSIISAMVLSGFFIMGIVWTYVTDKNKGLSLISLTTIIIGVSVSLSYKMPMSPRYLIIFLPIFTIGIAASYQIVNNKKAVCTLIALFIIASSPILINYYSSPSKEDWRGFSSQLKQLTNVGDTVVVIPGYVAQPLNYYYSNKSDGTFEYDWESYNKNDPAFIVITNDNKNESIMNWINESSVLQLKVPGISLYKTEGVIS